MSGNLQDAKRMLDELPTKVGLKVLRRAGKRAGEIIRDEASRRAPHLTGALEGHMMIKTKKESDTAIWVEIRPGKAEFYGRFQELGTKRMKANPFIAPAVDARGDEAAAVFENELMDEATKAWERS